MEHNTEKREIIKKKEKKKYIYNISCLLFTLHNDTCTEELHAERFNDKSTQIKRWIKDAPTRVIHNDQTWNTFNSSPFFICVLTNGKCSKNMLENGSANIINDRAAYLGDNTRYTYICTSLGTSYPPIYVKERKPTNITSQSGVSICGRITYRIASHRIASSCRACDSRGINSRQRDYEPHESREFKISSPSPLQKSSVAPLS